MTHETRRETDESIISHPSLPHWAHIVDLTYLSNTADEQTDTEEKDDDKTKEKNAIAKENFQFIP